MIPVLADRFISICELYTNSRELKFKYSEFQNYQVQNLREVTRQSIALFSLQHSS